MTSAPQAVAASTPKGRPGPVPRVRSDGAAVLDAMPTGSEPAPCAGAPEGRPGPAPCAPQAAAASTLAPSPHVTLAEVLPATFAFEAAVFDFDGTLADSCGVWEQVDRDFFAARGLTYTPEYAARMASLGFEDGANYTCEAFGLADSVQDICDEWNRMGRALYASRVEMFPQALDYVRALIARGVPVAIATTNDPQVLAAMEPRVPLSALFPVRVHGCEVPHHSKEHPDIFLEAARRLGVAPAGCVVFEDSLAAIRTAQGVGMRCVGHASASPAQPLDAIAAQTGLVVDSWDRLLG